MAWDSFPWDSAVTGDARGALLVPPPMILCLLHVCRWPQLFSILYCAACPLGAVATWSSSSRGWWLPVTRALHRAHVRDSGSWLGFGSAAESPGLAGPLGAATCCFATVGFCWALWGLPRGIQLGLPGVGDGSRPGLLDSVHSAPSRGVSLMCQQCRSPKVSLEASRARVSVLLSCSVRVPPQAGV